MPARAEAWLFGHYTSLSTNHSALLESYCDNAEIIVSGCLFSHPTAAYPIVGKPNIQAFYLLSPVGNRFCGCRVKVYSCAMMRCALSAGSILTVRGQLFLRAYNGLEVFELVHTLFLNSEDYIGNETLHIPITYGMASAPAPAMPMFAGGAPVQPHLPQLQSIELDPSAASLQSAEHNPHAGGGAGASLTHNPAAPSRPENSALTLYCSTTVDVIWKMTAPELQKAVNDQLHKLGETATCTNATKLAKANPKYPCYFFLHFDDLHLFQKLRTTRTLHLENLGVVKLAPLKAKKPPSYRNQQSLAAAAN